MESNMSGFTELTKVKKFDYLASTDQYNGAAGVRDDNQVFVIFRVRDEDNNLLQIESQTIINAFYSGYIKIIDYIGSGEYSVSITENNPNDCDFIIKEYSYLAPSGYHVIRLIRGSLTGNCSVSVSIQMEEGKVETTSFVSCYLDRRTPPSFAMI